jgi:molecular chaperone DnaJ
MGRGSVIQNPCPTCRGSGTAAKQARIDVKIPRGVSDGQTLRLRGQGGEGQAGAPPGDLLVTVRVRGDRRFRRKGLDVHSDVKLSMLDAALGTQVPVETVDGKVALKVPPGTQPGAALRLKGRGVKGSRGATGDHYVHVSVEVPKDLTPKERELLESLKGKRK